MKTGFISYIIYILLSIILFGLVAYFIKRKSKNKSTFDDKKFLINYGSASVLFDRENNATLIPFKSDSRGVGRIVEGRDYLKAPYKDSDLGLKVREILSKSVKSSDSNGENLFPGGWKEFTLNKRNISICYKEGIGLVLNSTTRKSDGSYQYNFVGFEKVIDQELSDSEFGKEILNILIKCK